MEVSSLLGSKVTQSFKGGWQVARYEWSCLSTAGKYSSGRAPAFGFEIRPNPNVTNGSVRIDGHDVHATCGNSKAHRGWMTHVVRSCVIDGEAIVCDDNGLAVFDLIRGHGSNGRAVLCAFDLLEVNGEDVRREPIEDRKRRLTGLLRLQHDGIALNETFSGEGAVIYKHACGLGCEGIVLKRLGTPYRAGRSNHWLKIKNPDAPAVRRLEEEDWWS